MNFPQQKLIQSSQGSTVVSMIEASCCALILQKGVQHIVPFFSSHGPAAKEDKFGKYIAEPDIWHCGDPGFVKHLAKHEYSQNGNLFYVSRQCQAISHQLSFCLWP